MIRVLENKALWAVNVQGSIGWIEETG